MLVTIYSPPYREGLGEGLPPLGEVGGGHFFFTILCIAFSSDSVGSMML